MSAAAEAAPLVVVMLGAAFLLALCVVAVWAIIFAASAVGWAIKKARALLPLALAGALAGCVSGQGQHSIIGASMDWRAANSVPAGMVGQIMTAPRGSRQLKAGDTKDGRRPL